MLKLDSLIENHDDEIRELGRGGVWGTGML